jgi:hypothetical protein
MTTPRSVGRDAAVALLGFWVIASTIFLAGRWYLPSEMTGQLVARAAAAPPAEPTDGNPDDPLAELRTMLAAGGGLGAAVVIDGAVQVQDALTSVESLTEPCPLCMLATFGEPREVRNGDPTQIGHRFWTGSTVLTITASGAAIGTAHTDVRVTINAGGKVFFGRECSLTMESSEHAIYIAIVEGESVELFEARTFAGWLVCAVADNSTTGEAVTLTAVFAYEHPDLGH